MVVSYPVILRYLNFNQVTIEIENITTRTLSDLSIEFERSYLNHFREQKFTPELEHPYVVRLEPPLKPQEKRVIVGHIKADAYGRIKGELRVMKADRELAGILLSTYIFP